MSDKCFNCLAYYSYSKSCFEWHACVCECVWGNITHSAGGVDSGPLHGNSDAVEKDDDKNHMVKQLVSDDFIAGHTKPARHNHTRHGGLSDANIQHNVDHKINKQETDFH